MSNKKTREIYRGMEKELEKNNNMEMLIKRGGERQQRGGFEQKRWGKTTTSGY